MSDPTASAHEFVRPGQVAPDLPPPDACVRCGRTEASHIAATYADLANELDELLDARQREIRRQSDAGEISLAEAAYQRIEVMESHLAEITALRVRYFGQ